MRLVVCSATTPARRRRFLLKAVEISPPTNGSALTLNADGAFTYESADGVCPAPASFASPANSPGAAGQTQRRRGHHEDPQPRPVISVSLFRQRTGRNQGSPATIKVTATDPDNPAAKLRATAADGTTSDVVSRNLSEVTIWSMRLMRPDLDNGEAAK